MLKDSEELAKIVRGFANGHRISIMSMLGKTSGLSVSSLADVLGVSFRTASEHSQRLEEAGLVAKKRRGQQVEHQLTPLGRRSLRYLKDLRELK